MQATGRPQLQLKQQLPLQRTNQACKFHATSNKMASVSDLTHALTPALLHDVHQLWFDHLDHEESLILPGGSEMGKWFTADEAFDQACV
jgi:hypothetical protein